MRALQEKLEKVQEENIQLKSAIYNEKSEKEPEFNVEREKVDNSAHESFKVSES